MASQFIKYIANGQHYEDVLSKIESVKHDLWIGTADIKDVYVKSGKDAVPLLSVLDKLVRRGVTVRLIHAKEPGPAFRKEHELFPELWTGMERLLCTRVHFKMIIFDLETAYIGSANLTGAGIGMKSENRRNFEAGILTNDAEIVEQAIEQFDNVWIGKFCSKCGRKEFCKDKIK